MSEVLIYNHQDSRKSGTIFLHVGPVPVIHGPETEAVAPPKPQTLPIRKRTSFGLLLASKIVGVAGAALLLLVYIPPFISNLSAYKPTNKEILLSSTVQNKKTYTPPLDTSLPIENTLIIPSIGVKTVLQEAPLDKYEDALRKGVWRVTDFGSPADQSKPTILAAHRYGYLFWTNSFRKQNSFYNLPNLKVGETVEIDFGQRRYIYKVYGEATDTQITDYTADLILYTCQNLTGDMRIFKYAKLVTQGN